jgi:hypothetical protein
MVKLDNFPVLKVLKKQEKPNFAEKILKNPI